MNNNSLNGSSHSERENYLSTVSPQDKPWEVKKAKNTQVRDLYRGTIFDALVSRIDACGAILEFGCTPPANDGTVTLKLKSARFCRTRFCPICQWRRSLMWFSRFINALPEIQKDYPSARYIFLTLTVRNCTIEELKTNIKWMHKSWDKFSRRKAFPGIGYARTLEVTRNRKEGTVHPHFHVLLMVNADYFSGQKYLNQKQWVEMWKSSLDIEYDPIVNIKTVKPKKSLSNDSQTADTSDLTGQLTNAIRETFKYSVKEGDLIGKGNEDDEKFLEELTNQMHRVKAISLGGVFKKYLSEEDPEDLIGEDENSVEEIVGDIYFSWRERIKRYVKDTSRSADTSELEATIG